MIVIREQESCNNRRQTIPRAARAFQTLSPVVDSPPSSSNRHSSTIRHHHLTWQQLKESLAETISTRCFSSKLLQCLHARVVTSGLRHNLFISTLLIAKYFAFRNAGAARLLFDGQSGRLTKPLLWNSLISGYLRCGLPRLALDVFREMTARFPPECEPDRHTFHLALTACTRLSEFDIGFMVGSHARSLGFQSDLLVATALVVLNAKAGEIESARQVFDQMSVKDIVSWNAMISGYSQARLLLEAMKLFGKMRIVEGICAAESSLVSLLSCCGEEGWISTGQALHALIIITGFERNQLVLNSLLEMYIKCGCLEIAVQFFDRMVLKDSISFSSIIGGYLQNGQPSKALNTLYWMLLNTGISPTRPILLNGLLASASLGNWETGRWIQTTFLSSNNDDMASDASLITALIYMHACCGKMEIAFQLLETDVRVKGDVIAWNALMKACGETGDFRVVFELSLQMQRRGIHLDKATFLMLISIISANLLLRKGAETHALIVRRGFESERVVANSLIDMYGQVGKLESSYDVFRGIQEKNVVSWSSIIGACARNGDDEGAFGLFTLMADEKVRPNKFTFAALLSACSHGGFVEKGREVYESMEGYGLSPGIEHLTCLIDLFCRAGLLVDAHRLLKDLSLEDSTSCVLWGILLSGCRVHGNLIIGEEAARHLFRLEPGNAANYLMLADIYVLFGKMESSNGVLRLLKEKGLKKRLGCSWFDVG
ncbi:pentatricopeptide repeat-containing protein At4g13650-like [Phalaenopsis equestris]|uniref:pentatricopeptide repeat-containing protein At4g13650-like n=1 Tax=Phalaenopsis equestris TaxID=78828 RepID=UPI0009E45BED|nr:pentatricopeptide repeat-containing protein At4g13650-like [Phalaenopsis equestris]XP_020572293.1 pentatricopeptide repeat-containing protein At4g13650-like [Phalaenopsis equestris]